MEEVSVRTFQCVPESSGRLRLQLHEIHVWKKDLSLPPAELERCRTVLSTDELERAARFRFEANRNEYIVSRGTLRTLLGSYLNVPPRELCFVYSEYGRPSVAPGTSSRLLNFNIGHSGKVVLLAFAEGRRVGIDVEKLRRDFSTSEIAERFFSMAEREALRALPQDQRHEAFFRCWTRKEAFIKALGEGMSHPLDQFDVSLAPSEQAVLLATRPDAQEAKRWKLWNIQLTGNYAAALAAEANGSPT